MARRRRRSGLLGLIAVVVLALLLVAYFQRHNVHIPLPNLGGTKSGGLGPLPAWNMPIIATRLMAGYFA
ncbi:MAG TPA: hypothetical protein VHX38_38890 [Pseudonocardiaceae bacterium]|jgi:hypothetical protein|nr:hypothetical protein [Pseudonocardiaceae bacterium]